jgi:hypothetical protein
MSRTGGTARTGWATRRHAQSVGLASDPTGEAMMRSLGPHCAVNIEHLAGCEMVRKMTPGYSSTSLPHPALTFVGHEVIDGNQCGLKDDERDYAT